MLKIRSILKKWWGYSLKNKKLVVFIEFFLKTLIFILPTNINKIFRMRLIFLLCSKNKHIDTLPYFFYEEEISYVVHDLHNLGCIEELKKILIFGTHIKIGIGWKLLGKFIFARYHSDGTIKNIALLNTVFKRPIHYSLKAMNNLKLRADLCLGLTGDINSYTYLLTEQWKIQKNLINLLGLEKSPLRYMTNYWIRKIGHIGHIDLYVKPLLLNLLPTQRLIILCKKSTEVANICLLNYWKKYITIIIDKDKFDFLDLESRILNVDFHLFEIANKTPMFYKKIASLAWYRWEKEKRPPLFNINISHRKTGWNLLKKMGMKENSWFVVVHARESGFAGDTQSPRNASIQNYNLAIKEIIARGGWVIRLGDKNMQKFPVLDRFWDYAHSDFKSDWMDIFLLAECKFYIGAPSGPATVPPLFGVPCVFINWIPIADYPFHDKALLITKKGKSTLTNENIHYQHLATLGSDYYKTLELINVRYEENTAQEILEVVIEMMDTLDKKLLEGDINNKYQAQFRKVVGIKNALGRPKLGRKFIMENANLLHFSSINSSEEFI